eukprot:8983868-Pyramimonas_sp.AAC.1
MGDMVRLPGGFLRGPRRSAYTASWHCSEEVAEDVPGRPRAPYVCSGATTAPSPAPHRRAAIQRQGGAGSP